MRGTVGARSSDVLVKSWTERLEDAVAVQAAAHASVRRGLDLVLGIVGVTAACSLWFSGGTTFLSVAGATLFLMAASVVRVGLTTTSLRRLLIRRAGEERGILWPVQVEVKMDEDGVVSGGPGWSTFLPWDALDLAEVRGGVCRLGGDKGVGFAWAVKPMGGAGHAAELVAFAARRVGRVSRGALLPTGEIRARWTPDETDVLRSMRPVGRVPGGWAALSLAGVVGWAVWGAVSCLVWVVDVPGGALWAMSAGGIAVLAASAWLVQHPWVLRWWVRRAVRRCPGLVEPHELVAGPWGFAIAARGTTRMAWWRVSDLHWDDDDLLLAMSSGTVRVPRHAFVGGVDPLRQFRAWIAASRRDMPKPPRVDVPVRIAQDPYAPPLRDGRG